MKNFDPEVAEKNKKFKKIRFFFATPLEIHGKEQCPGKILNLRYIETGSSY